MEVLESLRRDPSEFIHRKETTVDDILSLFKTLETLLLIGKYNFGYCYCEKCRQVCKEMRKEKIIPDEVITELVHTGKDVTANPWIGPYGVVRLCEHIRNCRKCKESDKIQNSYSEKEISPNIFRVTDRRTGESSDELEIWAAGMPHRIKLD